MILASPFLAIGTRTGTAGTSELLLQIPGDLARIGFQLSCQWIVWDPGVNPLGVTLSDSLRLTIGVTPP